MTEELKPCPFHDGTVHGIEVIYGNHGYAVRCRDCGSRSEEYMEESIAIKHWNTRHTPDVQAQLSQAQARIVELEALYASVEEMYTCLRKYWPEGTVNGLVEEYQKQQARIAELEKDAARYRWLRAQNESPIGDFRVHQNIGHDWNYAENLDLEIDTAMKEPDNERT